MPPKAKIPAPIDRPLSRAYLREFSGWSTAYPPGVSDSTSLRIMENTMIQRDGSMRIRPGMRLLSYAEVPDETEPTGIAFDLPVVGTHEPFFLNNGTKAYLFAVREADQSVGFRVLANTDEGQVVVSLTDVGFAVPQGEPFLAFTEATTYVKYLQIDNKILALSDAGETMRMFLVGASKLAKRIISLDRPEWAIEDKLTVVHPDVAWLNSGAPLTTRTNLVLNPTVEENLLEWTANANTDMKRDVVQSHSGGWALHLKSLPERTNLVPAPLHDPAGTGLLGWAADDNAAISLDAAPNAMKILLDAGAIGKAGYGYSTPFPVKVGTEYAGAYDVSGFTNIRRLWVSAKFYNSAGVKIGADVNYGNNTIGVGRRSITTIKPPTGATQMRVAIHAERKTSSGANSVSIKNVVVCEKAESTAMFHGGSGANYYWTGATNDSASVYHPPKNIAVWTTAIVEPGDHIASTYIRGTAVRNVQLDVQYKSATATLTTLNGTVTPDTTSSWTRLDTSGAAPAGTTKATLVTTISAVPRGETHYVDSTMLEKGLVLDDYFAGDTPDSPGYVYEWVGDDHKSKSTEKTYAVGGSIPAPETRTPDTLISSVGADNKYNFAFFYTIYNEVGESAASNVTTLRTKRPWASWSWELPNGAGEPSGTPTGDPSACADQLIAYMPEDVFDTALANGANGWHLYMYTWSDQDPVPVTAVRVATREFTFPDPSVYEDIGWARVTPSMSDAGTEQMATPSRSTRHNYSDPSRGGQGIVAADRLVLVKDPTNAAVIRWTSNQQGSYLDFTSSRGGGFKTLTSGNLFIPACVKLWQNPQSTDTLTILCRGVDGYNTGYYMAPAQIASQSEAVNIMGFEETTATPGTTSPYGCEVFNNALYHPLDDQLMKSTATNYNINHKSQTDLIENVWKALTRKEWIISSVHDNRIYYIVNNPAGEPLEPGCNGNEVWVFDGGASSDKGGGSWSRWMIQSHSLRKIEQGGVIRMSIVRPSGIFYFDDTYGLDDYVDVDLKVQTRAIPWTIETNTQGANRAHDAWANLQQCDVVVGNFQGSMCYGVRGMDVHGRPIDICKIVSDHNEPTFEKFDLESYLLVQKTMKEWFFYARSMTDEESGEVLPSFGEINLVQYRYSPISVNVGYEYGSVETFEYRRAERAGMMGEPDVLTVDGVPRPYIDTRRP